jgi:hypothetical protein
MGVGNLKFTIYVPLVPKMHHIKFEKNWSSGYQEVKNVQMWTLHIMFGPALWAKPLPRGRIMKFTILVKVFLVYITMHLVFLIYM